jgi:hypothetical protein
VRPTVLRSCAANHLDGSEPPVKVNHPGAWSLIPTVLEIADCESFSASVPREVMDHGACGFHNFSYLIIY